MRGMSIQFYNRRGTGSIKWDRIGEDVLPLWVADMDVASPEVITEAISRRLQHPVFGYTDPDDEFFRSFAEWTARRQGWRPERKWQLYAPGMMPAVRALVAGFAEPSQGVIVQSPVYHPFFTAVTGQGRKLLENPLVRREDGGYEMNLRELEQLAALPDARVLLLCSPHNPVGRVWTVGELEAMMNIVVEHNLVVVADEIHGDLILPGNRFESLGRFLTREPWADRAEDSVVVLQSPGKTFNIPGLPSCQAVAAGEGLRRGVRRSFEAAGFDISNILSLEASKAGYRGGDAWLDEVMDHVAVNRGLLARGVSRLAALVGAGNSPGALPESGDAPGHGVTEAGGSWLSPAQGTYLAWWDASPLCRFFKLDAEQLNRRIRDEAGVFFSSGPQFGAGGEGFLRVNLGCSREMLREALERLEAWLTKVVAAEPGVR